MNEATPLALRRPEEAEAVVVKFIVPGPVTDPPVVVMANERLASPVTEKASALLVEPGTKPTSLVTDAEPAASTDTVPPVPTVNLPKLKTAALSWVTTSGDTIVADATPVAVEVLPEAAKADVDETATTRVARMIFFISLPDLKATSPEYAGAAIPLANEARSLARRTEVSR